jgi:transcriptional regulator with XRE-family HTH domain
MQQEFDKDCFIRTLRQKRIIEEDIDMRKLAKKIGCAPSTICRLENGAMPGVEVYANICKWLGEPMDTFIKNKKRCKAV